VKKQPLNNKDLPVVRTKLSLMLGILKGTSSRRSIKPTSQDKLSIGKVSLVKGEVSRTRREFARLASELLKEEAWSMRV
jgi:hypothetical protein